MELSEFINTLLVNAVIFALALFFASNIF